MIKNSDLESLCKNCGLCCFSSQTLSNRPWCLGLKINNRVYNRNMFAESTSIIKKYPGRIEEVESKEGVQYFIKWNKNISVDFWNELYYPCSFLEFNLDKKNKVIKRMYCLIHGDGSENDPRDYACVGHKPRIVNDIGCSVLFQSNINKVVINGVVYHLNKKIRSVIKCLS